MSEALAIEPVSPHLLRSLREHVHERLRRAIVAGRFRNGERLNERSLADMLGVSTTPVKDAIRMLESEGLVRTEARRGEGRDLAPPRIGELRKAVEEHDREAVPLLVDRKADPVRRDEARRGKTRDAQRGRSAVRIAAPPPFSLMLPASASAVPSQRKTCTFSSTMLETRIVLLSSLKLTPCDHWPIGASAAFVSVVPATR